VKRAPANNNHAPTSKTLTFTAATRSQSGGGGGGQMSGGMLRFYTDDAPGLKITPLVVLVMSLGFVGFVTLLHIWGKLRGMGRSSS